MPATMNSKQVARQIKHMAALATISGSNLIFPSPETSIHVFGKRSTMYTMADFVYPMLAIYENGHTTPFRNAKVIHRTSFDLLILVDNNFDMIGEYGVLGNAQADATDAADLGCLDIFDLLERDSGAFRKTGADAGLGIVAFTSSSSGPEDVSDNNDGSLIGLRATLEVIHANDDSEYEQPRALTVADGGSGVANVSWTPPGNRYDNGGVYIRYASGATAPATTSSGTELGKYARGTTSATPTLGSGQFSFSCWGLYDPDTFVVAGSNPDTDDCDTFSSGKQTATVTLA